MALGFFTEDCYGFEQTVYQEVDEEEDDDFEFNGVS